MQLDNHLPRPALKGKDLTFWFSIFTLLLALMVSSAFAQVARRGHIQGKGVAVDGDTIKVGHFSVRLVGIDAPEIEQNCPNKRGKKYPCGLKAKAKLESLLKKGTLYCQRRGNAWIFNSYIFVGHHCSSSC